MLRLSKLVAEVTQPPEAKSDLECVMACREWRFTLTRNLENVANSNSLTEVIRLLHESSPAFI